MKHLHWIVVVLCLASLAGVVLLTQRFHGVHSSGPEQRAELEGLHARLERLEYEHRLAERAQQRRGDGEVRAATNLAGESGSDRPTDTPAELGELTVRLAQLEALASDLDRRPPDAWQWNPNADAVRALLQQLELNRDDYPELDWLTSIEDALSPEGIARLQAMLNDPQVPWSARAEALRALRDAGGALSQNLLDESACAVALTMIDQAASDADKARVYGVLKGQNYPFLRGPFMASARNDPSPRIRDDAVTALSHFLPDPECEELLRWIRDNDPDASVRDEADEALRTAAD